MSNSMRQDREKKLAEKRLRMALSADPRLLKKRVAKGLEVDPENAAVQADTDATTPTANVELRLFNHLNQLKDNKSVQDKIELKKQWLPEYFGYIDVCLAISPSAQNTSLVTLMIWAVDAGQYELAVRIAEYALLNDMVMPEGHSRGIAEFVTEQCANDFNDDVDLAIENAEVIQRIIDLGVGEQMVDQVRAKIFRSLGDALNEAQPVEALNAYKNALRLNSKVGCKKEVTALEKLLNKQSTESSPDATVGSQADSTTVSAAAESDPASTDSTPTE